jgi:ribulose-phosphate 3-epimerase
MTQKIIPAILTSDPEDLRAKLQFFKGESEWMHIDIMDGRFVPNISVSVRDLLAPEGRAGDFRLEIHLMVQNPQAYLADCKAVGASRIIIHQEAAGDIEKALREMKAYGLQAGIALNPATPADAITRYANDIASVLVMAINPGSQGQEFMPSVLEKIPAIKKDFPHLLIGVDGGVGEANISQVLQAGAEYAVVGSKIFEAEDPVEAFRKLKEKVGIDI